MFSSYFWFNVPIPENLMHLPSKTDWTGRSKALSFVNQLFVDANIVDHIKLEIDIASINVVGNTTFNSERGIRDLLTEIYKQIASEFSEAHGAGYFRDWEEEEWKYEIIHFVKGSSHKETFSF